MVPRKWLRRRMKLMVVNKTGRRVSPRELRSVQLLPTLVLCHPLLLSPPLRALPPLLLQLLTAAIGYHDAQSALGREIHAAELMAMALQPMQEQQTKEWREVQMRAGGGEDHACWKPAILWERQERGTAAHEKVTEEAR